MTIPTGLLNIRAQIYATILYIWNFESDFISLQVSFVNLVNTSHGGDNVKVVSKAIAKHLFETIKEKDKNPTLNSDENENENQNLNFDEAKNPNL